MKPYDYQEEAISDLEYAVEVEGLTDVVLFAPVSYGKSIVLSELAARLTGKIIILLNVTALVDQIAEHLDELGTDYSILKAGYEERFDPTKKVQIVMSQTYFARYESIDFGPIGFVLQDECHREWKTDRTMRVMQTLLPQSRIGVSGTPYDAAGYALDGVDEMITTRTVKQLEEGGFTAPLKYYIPKWAEEIDYSELRKSGADYSGAAVDELINTDEYAKLVVESMNQMNAKEKKCLVFCNSIEHCDTITEELLSQGYKALAYHSKNGNKDVKEKFQSFLHNRTMKGDLIDSSDWTTRVLVSVAKLSVGFSVKDINLGVITAPTQVRSKHIQILGRMQRIHPDKEFGEILDLAKNCSSHGFHDEEYYPPKKGDMLGLAQAKLEAQAPLIGDLAGKEPTLITREMIKVRLEQIKREEENIETLPIEKLTTLFEITQDLTVAMHIAFKINEKVRGITFKDSSINWTIQPALDMLVEFPEYRHRLIKTLKTRMNNIVRQSKKLSAIHYFPEWLKNNPPYNYGADDFTVRKSYTGDNHEEEDPYSEIPF